MSTHTKLTQVWVSRRKNYIAVVKGAQSVARASSDGMHAVQVAIKNICSLFIQDDDLAESEFAFCGRVYVCRSSPVHTDCRRSQLRQRAFGIADKLATLVLVWIVQCDDNGKGCKIKVARKALSSVG